MNEIKCPNCGEVFTVNESQYAELLSQVRTAEFDKELHDRMRQELALALLLIRSTSLEPIRLQSGRDFVMLRPHLLI